MYGNLRVFSEYSLEYGCIKINDIAKIAKKFNYKYLCITDYYSISGSVNFFEELKKVKIKPLLGCQINCFLKIEENVIYGKLTLIVKNKKGYKNICKIISKKKKYNLKKIYKKKGIYLISGVNGGILEKLYKKKNVIEKKKKIKKEKFRKKTIKIFKKRIEKKNKKYLIYKKRIEKEIKIIYEMGYADYFLVVSDFINWAKKKKIAVGPGRGSSAGSLVAYIYNITEVDPIKNNLYFERFLNYKRKSVPDFDIDFCKNKRFKVISYLKKKYGKENVFNISTFGKFSLKNSIRDSGRILGYRFGFVEKISNLINKNKKNKLVKDIEKDKDIKKRFINDKKFKKILFISKMLEGYVRNIGIHAGGIVITKKKFYNYMPLYYNKKEKKFSTQFNKLCIEKMGFIKFDFLCLNTLSLLDNISRSLKIKIDFNNNKFDDEKTYNLISEGNTTGIFQLENYNIRKYIKVLKPKNFRDILNIISIYRPGTMSLIKKYCYKKKIKNKFMNEKTEKILKETKGLVIFQEQLMKILKIYLGLDLNEADIIRNFLNKNNKIEIEKIKKKILNKYLEKNKNSKKKEGEEFYNYIKKHSGYSFNKAHAVSYTYITYIMAWFKANHKRNFIINCLNNSYKNKKKTKELYKDLYRNKIKLKNPDINKSKELFDIKNKKNNIGFLFIKGIGKNVSDKILEERKKKKFINFDDFYVRINKRVVNKRIIKSLIYSGCFDKINKNRIKTINNFSEFKKNYLVKSQLYKNQKCLLEIKKNIKEKKKKIIKKEKDRLGVILCDVLKIKKKKIKKMGFVKKNCFWGEVKKKFKKKENFYLLIENKELYTFSIMININFYNNIKEKDIIIYEIENIYIMNKKKRYIKKYFKIK